MKQTIYLVRHGDKVKRMGDPPLSDKGVLQAKATGQYFKSLQIQKIIASPISRSRQTAKYIADALALEVLTHDLLKERVNWGDDPHQTFENFLAMWNRASSERNWIPTIGDSSRAAGERLNTLVTSRIGPVDHVILVTHGGIITDFLRNIFDEQILNAKFNGFNKTRDENILECSITTIGYNRDNSTYELIELASTKHLQEI